MQSKTAVRFIKRTIRNVLDFFYCSRDRLQEGVEKVLNIWIYEIIAFVGLVAGCLGIGIGKSDWNQAGLLWAGPTGFTFLLNLFIILNWFSMMKRNSNDQIIVNFPPQVKNLLLLNILLGFFFPYGIFAKSLFYKHFYALYKQNQLYWANPNDTRQERRKRYREYRAQKRREMDSIIG
ncbi:hypothetical protein DNK47_00865 [Mycoplasma wenyonii]|uniref:Uncharacterized protein n=1 Tax=Mycoplasma wenyonii TaxID=65123 RepID=A0A328PN70_9MOLU|nr:hypothetical protein [Mycoplasma wenyonii]RAO95165.1 hypothetical protein DNK47_00865 [Mycoplasma wenyonii]